MTEQYLGLLVAAMCMTFLGGLAVGLMWRVFREDDRSSTNRFPRPGTQPTRPEGLKPYRKSHDMLTDESKKP